MIRRSTLTKMGYNFNDCIHPKSDTEMLDDSTPCLQPKQSDPSVQPIQPGTPVQPAQHGQPEDPEQTLRTVESEQTMQPEKPEVQNSMPGDGHCSETVKAETGDMDPAIPDQVLQRYLDNEFVDKIAGNRIFYTKAFFPAMYRKIHDEGMSYVEAYESLGFKISELGKNRAEQAGKKTMDKAEKDQLYTVDLRNYDGSIPLDEMPSMTMAEELAYLQSRVIYLEALVEAQKKIRSILADSSISLSRNFQR